MKKLFVTTPSFLLFFLALLFTRLWNLDSTARFIWDESSDLVHMHQIFVEKKLTLVGPISEDGTKVFGSLTYYMLLPFAILGKFDPVSPAVGAAFWGILTAAIALLLTKTINPKLLIYICVLVLIWFPLIQTSRWAWNPNLIPFWVALSLIFYQRRLPGSLFLSGLFLGLTIHHHYLSAFAVDAFTLATLIKFWRQKQLSLALSFTLGTIASLIPFIVFDLRHPPGLFLTKLLYFNHINIAPSLPQMLTKFASLYQSMLTYYAPVPILATLLGSGLILLLLLDIKSKSASLIFALPWILHLTGLTFIYYDGNSVHYFLPSTIFFLIWLIFPRKSSHLILAKAILGVLILASAFSIIPQLTTKTWQTDIPSVRNITQFISTTITTGDLKNANIAVLASPDNNIYGRRYRDLLLLQNVPLKTKEEYQISDHLFAISTATESELRLDPAFEMKFFRKGPLIKTQPIPNSPWTVYLFNRNPK